MKKSILIHPDELSKVWIDRMIRENIDVIALHPPGGNKAHEYLAKMLEMLEAPEYRALLDYAAEQGLKIEYEMHAAGYLLSKNLFASHPEYFRMNEKGERVPDMNFCVSNEEALDIVVKRAADLAKKLYRSEPNYYFWLDDGKNVHCRCPKCQRLNPSDQLLTVVNAMLKEIKKDRPDAKMAYLAYHDSMMLPENVKQDEDIFIEYAPIAKYSKNAEEIAAKEKAMLSALLTHFGIKDSKVLEYWIDNSLFSGWKKPPQKMNADAEAAKQDVREYTDMGFEYISVFGCYLGPDYEELYGEPDISAFTKAFD